MAAAFNSDRAAALRGFQSLSVKMCALCSTALGLVDALQQTLASMICAFARPASAFFVAPSERTAWNAGSGEILDDVIPQQQQQNGVASEAEDKRPEEAVGDGALPPRDPNSDVSLRDYYDPGKVRPPAKVQASSRLSCERRELVRARLRATDRSVPCRPFLVTYRPRV